MPRVLVADDEPNICDVVRYALERDGLEVETVSDGCAAVARITAGGIDLLVLDVLMPELDGLSVCRRLRTHGDIPIIFLSSRGEEADLLAGLELGGDDYVTKPFSPRELSARVRSLLRRSGVGRRRDVVRHGELELDLDAFEARVSGTRVELTATELRLLCAICARPHKAFNRHQLIALAYPGANHISPRTIDTHIRRIRAKLRPFAIDPIETVHGLGYRCR